MTVIESADRLRRAGESLAALIDAALTDGEDIVDGKAWTGKCDEALRAWEYAHFAFCQAATAKEDAED